MLTVEYHRQTVPFDSVGVTEWAKVVPFDDKGRIGGPTFEMSGRIDRMNNRETNSPAGFQNTRYFTNNERHGVNVVKRHEGDRKVRAGVVQWQRGRVGKPNIH